MGGSQAWLTPQYKNACDKKKSRPLIKLYENERLNPCTRLIPRKKNMYRFNLVYDNSVILGPLSKAEMWEYIIHIHLLLHSRVASPNFGNPALTSSVTKYKVLQVKNSFLNCECQFWNCFSFRKVIYYLRSMSLPTASTTCVILEWRS